MSDKEKWYTLTEAEKVAGVSKGTLNRAIRLGRLVASQISDSSRHRFHYMVSETALLEWVEDSKKQRAESGEMTIDNIAEWLKAQMQKAYNEGYRDGMKAAKAQVLNAVKGVK